VCPRPPTERSHARRCGGPGGGARRDTEPRVLLRACTQAGAYPTRTASRSERAKPGQAVRPVTLSAAAQSARGQRARGRGGPCRIVGPIWYLARSCRCWDRRWPVRSWRLNFFFCLQNSCATGSRAALPPPILNGFSACSSDSCNNVTDYFTCKRKPGRLFTADSNVPFEL
jgi:hypothetical protein